MTSANRLAGEASPYLLQHAGNPVAWRPWGPDALAEAQRENKPVLLSVGYAACHWCHVMAHESFEDEAVAAVMNANFVNIKVDREERPDIDQIYMSALHALGEHGGWPLTMFLTPDGEPFWGGTYFPKEPRYGRPGFVDVLVAVAGVFRDEPDKIEQNRAALLARLRQRAPPAGAVDPQVLDVAAARLVELTDPVRGGTRGAPKFPNAGLFELFWRAWFRGGDVRYRDAVLLALQEICQGGITDHLGGGFARYSVDADWLVPHFEKMLYDNAQLVALLADAWALTRRPLFKARIEETVGWLVREMTTAGGAFAASLDADSEGEEGKFYVWTSAEIVAALGPEDAAFFARIYDVSAEGNWEGKVVLNRTGQPDLLDEATEVRLAGLRAKLLDVRSRRVRPGLDDKVLADWNGLMIAALAHAGEVCGRDDWIALAERAYGFVVAEMSRDGRFGHSFRDGRLLLPGLASDHAAMIRAALALRQARRSERYLGDALAWCGAVERHYATGDGGFYWTADDAEALIVRPSSPADEAVPNANGLMAQNYATLFALTGEPRWREKAEAVIAAHGAAMADNAFACASLLNGLDQLINATSVVIAGRAAGGGAVVAGGADRVGAAATVSALVAAAVGTGNPAVAVSVVSEETALPDTHPAFGKLAPEDQPASFVCRRQTCSLPITDPAELRAVVGPAAV